MKKKLTRLNLNYFIIFEFNLSFVKFFLYDIFLQMHRFSLNARINDAYCFPYMIIEVKKISFQKMHIIQLLSVIINRCEQNSRRILVQTKRNG